MKTVLALAWVASAGAVYWAPWPSASSGQPETWVLVLVGAAVVAFVVARRN